MSGGIFPNYPFVLNIKCIIFALIIMGIYTYCPPKLDSNIKIFFVYFIIFVISYVALAWYDYYYVCQQLPLQKGPNSVTATIKPPIVNKNAQILHLMTPQEVDKNNRTIFWMHLLIIVPILAYVGFSKEKTHKRIFDLIIVLAIFTAIYHGSRALTTSH
jgi:hypothetical protein